MFEVYLDEETGELEPWSNSPFFETIEFNSTNQSIYEVTVPTPENVSINYWLSMLVDRKGMCVKEPSLLHLLCLTFFCLTFFNNDSLFKAAAMLVGIAGCGKTQLLKGLLGRQDEEKRISCTINMNYFTTTNLLQSSMETVLVKKTGTSFGPPGKADLIYFIDDLNLPEVDQYDTQSAISLLRMVSGKNKTVHCVSYFLQTMLSHVRDMYTPQSELYTLFELFVNCFWSFVFKNTILGHAIRTLERPCQIELEKHFELPIFSQHEPHCRQQQRQPKTAVEICGLCDGLSRSHVPVDDLSNFFGWPLEAGVFGRDSRHVCEHHQW